MKQLLLITSTILLILTVVNAQTTFQKSYGGTMNSAYHMFSSAQQTSDSGYIVTGYELNTNGGAYLLKMNSGGNVLWSKAYDYPFEPRSILQTSDGGFIIGGDVATLTKTDANGNILWNKFYSGTASDVINCMEQTKDGGFILAGYGWVLSIYYPLLIRTDSLGDTLWVKKTNIGGQYDNLYSVAETDDGGFIGTGSSGADVLLFRVNSNGNLIWNKKVGVVGVTEFGRDIIRTSDGAYVITGEYSPATGSDDLLLFKCDSLGNILWAKRLGQTWNEYGYDIKQTADSGLIITGNYSPNQNDAMLMKTDKNGNHLWTKRYGGSGDEYGYNVRITNDGGFLIAGETTSFKDPAAYRNAYLVKTDSQGMTPCNTYTVAINTYTISLTSTALTSLFNPYSMSIVSPSLLSMTPQPINDVCSTVSVNNYDEVSVLNIFPNPFSMQTVFHTDNLLHNATLTVDNIFGQTVAQIKNINGQTTTFSRDNLASGLYFVRLTEKNKIIAVDKLVITDK